MTILSDKRLLIILWLMGFLLACHAMPVIAQEAIAKEPDHVVTVIATINDRLHTLEDRERKQYEMIVEGQHKAIDWAFSLITLLTAVLAINGIFVPIILYRKNKELLERDKVAIEKTRKEVEEILGKIKQHQYEADQVVKQAKQDGVEIGSILKEYRSDEKSDEVKSQKINEAVATAKSDKTLDLTSELRAAAIEASQAEQVEKAYSLWNALVELEVNDFNVLFNTGYWAAQLALISTGDEAIRLFKKAGEKFQQALSIKPDDHDAVYNWGNALADEAQALAASDLLVARGLRQQAGEKYQQALSIKPDKHEAANNWGVALAAEAQALAVSDLSAARSLWQQAGEKCQQALSIKLDKHEAAYNWSAALFSEARAIAGIDNDQARQLQDQAEKILLQHAKAVPEKVAYNLACVYGQRGEVATCLHWLKIAQEHKTLASCEHLQTDIDLDPVRDHPDFQAWLQSVCP